MTKIKTSLRLLNDVCADLLYLASARNRSMNLTLYVQLYVQLRSAFDKIAEEHISTINALNV